MNIDEKEIELFIEETKKAADMQTWAIPPELMPYFLNHSGFYPFYLVFKKGIEYGKLNNKEET